MFKITNAIEFLKYCERSNEIISQICYIVPIIEYEFPEADVTIDVYHECGMYEVSMNIRLDEYPEDIISRIDKVADCLDKKFPGCRDMVFISTNFEPTCRKKIITPFIIEWVAGFDAEGSLVFLNDIYNPELTKKFLGKDELKAETRRK
jgi:hypothetical protein